MNNPRVFVLAVAASLSVSIGIEAQRGGGAPAGPPQSGRAAAADDLTGTWVSVVAEHWHLRMLVPPRGEFAMLPLNQTARKIASTWDPAKEPAGDEQCKSYGAAAIMRIPSRLDIRWAGDNTLRMDIDSGTQTRMFNFALPQGQGAPSESRGGGGAAPATQAPSWQGYSTAAWVRGDLQVVTTRMRPGYLRKNGVPYSEQARLEEHFDRFTEPNGDNWLVVDSIVTDPVYLTGPYITSVAFKKIPDKQGWDPTPCRANEAR
jgi:hypothetical protein